MSIYSFDVVNAYSSLNYSLMMCGGTHDTCNVVVASI